jgi:D-alanine-D-alanine ligase
MINDSRKIRVGIMFGGKSAEHEVSIQSARNVLHALDTNKFEPVLIGIDKQGKWHLNHRSNLLLESQSEQTPKLQDANDSLTLVPGSSDGALVSTTEQSITEKVDVVFPILHGPMGEDGTMQGLLELANVPYVGPGVLGSAIGMDKDVMKRLLHDAGVPITDFITLRVHERTSVNSDKVIERLGLPLFVKPANMGSSVGVSKVETAADLLPAIDQAFQYDTKILLEKAVEGDEVECAVLGNNNPEVSVPGRIIPQKNFYSYEAKYIDEDGAILEIPAQLPDEVIAKVQQVALHAFQVLEAEGMGRMDMFVTKSGEVVFNEINTIPGFTKISMYPQLWQASGLSYTDLITRLLELAIERFTSRHQLRSTYLDE